MNAWKTVALGDIVTIVGGGTPTRSNPDFYGGPIPWVTPKDMKSWDIRGAQVTITDSGLANSAARLVPINSILIVVRSGVLKHTIPVGVNRLPVAINQDMKALQCRNSVDADFLARFIKAQSSVILQWVRATTADNFPIEKLKNLSVPLPPLDEQRRIAEMLDRAEVLRAKRRAALAQLDTLAQSLFLDLFGDPIQNPQGFPSCPLIDLVDPQRPISYGILKPGPNQDEGIKYVRVVDMKDGGIELSGIRRTTEAISDTFRRSLLKQGDLLMSIRGHVGRCALVPPSLDGANITQDTARLAIQGASSIFVREALRTEGLQRWMAKHTKGVAVRGINLGDVKMMPVILPTRKQQDCFVNHVAIVETLNIAHRSSLVKLDALIASLQHRAFRGEL